MMHSMSLSAPRGHRAFTCARPRQACAKARTTCRATTEPEDASSPVATKVPLQTVDIPTRLNATPCDRETRRWFYRDTAASIVSGLKSGEKRMCTNTVFTELNPEMDVYRVGTLLEMTREIASSIAEDGSRVKVCVQGSMGAGIFTALPLTLNGVKGIMEKMDWGEVNDFVTLGAVGEDEIDDDTDVYLLLAPQNIIGGCVLTNLGEMVDAVEAAGKQIVLLNPTLVDVPSSGGVMGIRGRGDRVKFAESFERVYHFRLLYFSGSYYPIVGALRMAHGGLWQIYKRVQLGQSKEEYQLWGEFEKEPKGPAITECLKKKYCLRLQGTSLDSKPKTAGNGSFKWW